eukprot:COSAG01_NODE_5411_length_4280_cov_6.071275_3_plen_59_part_00
MTGTVSVTEIHLRSPPIHPPFYDGARVIFSRQIWLGAGAPAPVDITENNITENNIAGV